jgi:Ca-activated chloride channel family protein
MSWGQPELLVLLVAVPILAWGLLVAWRRRVAALHAFAAAPALAALVPPGILRARASQAVLSCVALTAAVLAAAGPRLGFHWQQQTMQGIQLVVVLDVSRSMDATDAPPSRLEQARRELQDLVAQLRGDAVGLVVFAAGSHVRIPPTVDYDTFLWAARDSSSETLEAQGTHLAGALDGATQLLTRARGSGRAIVLVSDGEDHGSAEDLDLALQRARDADVRVFALGVGTPEGAPVPLQGGGFKTDSRGAVVVSRLQEDVLRKVASATGGAYVRAVPSDDDVRALVQDEIRGKLAAGARGVRRERVWHERFQWPLAVALFAMAGSAAWGVRRRAGAARVAAIAPLLLLALHGEAWAGAREDGAAALRARRWDEAVRHLGQARVERPADHEVSWMLGEALLRSGRAQEAEGVFRDLAVRDPARKARHLYNAGHAAYAGGRLEQAERDFSAAVEADPTLKQAESNRDAVRREVAARRSPPQNKPQDGQNGSEGGGSGAQGAQGQAQPQGGNGAAASKAADDKQRKAQGREGNAPEGNPEGSPSGESAARDAQASRERADRTGEGSADGGVRESGDSPPGAPEEGVEEGAAGLQAQGNSSSVSEAAVAPSGPLRADEAARLVDAVPDGRPRVVLQGNVSKEDW